MLGIVQAVSRQRAAASADNRVAMTNFNLQNLASGLSPALYNPGTALTQAAAESRKLAQSAQTGAARLLDTAQRDVQDRTRDADAYVKQILTEVRRLGFAATAPIEKLLSDTASRGAALATQIPGSLRALPTAIYSAIFGGSVSAAPRSTARPRLESPQAAEASGTPVASEEAAGEEAASEASAPEAAASVGVSAATTPEKAVLSFGQPHGFADWEPTLEGRLVAGGQVEVKYNHAEARFSERVQATQGGYAQWGVSGFAQVNAREPVRFEATQSVPEVGLVARPTTLDLPEPGELKLWFSASNRYGHEPIWDSNDSHNYRLPIEQDASALPR